MLTVDTITVGDIREIVAIYDALTPKEKRLVRDVARKLFAEEDEK